MELLAALIACQGTCGHCGRHPGVAAMHVCVQCSRVACCGCLASAAGSPTLREFSLPQVCVCEACLSAALPGLAWRDWAGAVMRLRAAGVRESSRGQYQRSFWRSLACFQALRLPFPPTCELHLSVYAAHEVQVRGLQGSTVDHALSAFSGWFQEAQAAGLPVVNPVRLPGVARLRKTLRRRFKKESGAKIAFGLEQLRWTFATGYSVAGLCVDWGLHYSGGRLLDGAVRERMLRHLVVPAGGAARMEIRRNWHARFALTLLVLGMLRKNVLERLRVRYRLAPDGSLLLLPESDIRVLFNDDLQQHYLSVRVPGDKNLEGVRYAAIPEVVPGLGLSPVLEFCTFLRAGLAPPSGDFFFHAPVGHATAFYPHKEPPEKGYTQFASLVKRMYKAAFPAAQDVERYASHSGRKTLCQLLFDAGYPLRLLADAGGWSFGKAEALHRYFSCSVLTILRAVASIGVRG